MPQKRVLANGGLLEVRLGACQQAVVDFMFAALPDDRRRQLNGRSFGCPQAVQAGLE